MGSFHDFYFAMEKGSQPQMSSSNKGQAVVPYSRMSRSRNFLIGLLSLVLPFYIIISVLSNTLSTNPSIPFATQHASSVAKPKKTLVPLEAHIMSKCLDARDCLQDLVVPAMEQVVNKVDFTLSFIGSYVVP